MGTVITSLGWIWIGLSLLTMSSAQAVDTSQAANPFVTNPALRDQALPWSDETHNHPCDQACMLTKGNENLSLQALYLVSRIDELQSQYSSGNYTQVVSALWNFCGDTDPQSAKQDAARDCLERYVQAKSLDLRAIKAAMIRNRESQLSYKSVAKTPILASSGQEPAAKTPQYARAPTQKELDDEQRVLERLSSNSYAQWAATLPHEPQHRDYCKTTSEIDPEDATKKYQREQTLNGLCAAFDEDRYARDVEEYRSLRALTPTKPAADPRTASAQSVNNSRTVSVPAYQRARNEFTSKSNEDLQKKALATGQLPPITFPAGAPGDTPQAVPRQTAIQDLYTTRVLPEDIDTFLKKVDWTQGPDKTAPLDHFVDGK